MKTTFKVTDLFQDSKMKFKWITPEPSWSSLPQHKKEKKFMDVLTNGYPNDLHDDENYISSRFGPIGETYEQSIQRKILAETPTQRIIRIKKCKVKCYDVFRKGYANV